MLRMDPALRTPPTGIDFDDEYLSQADRSAPYAHSCSRGAVQISAGSDQTRGNKAAILRHYRVLLSDSGWERIPVDGALTPETRLVYEKAFGDWVAEFRVNLTRNGLGILALYPPVRESIDEDDI